MKRQMRQAERTQTTYNNRGRTVTIVRRIEPHIMTVRERREAHAVRHPNDLNQKRVVKRKSKPPTMKQLLREARLDTFYKTHEYVGTYPNTRWVPIGGEEE